MPAAWIDELNAEQRAAATHADGPLLVVAGAGTGKTRTLAARVAWLIERGVRAERILLLTFTRRAAAEMLRRARHLSGRADASRVWGGTFHSVANRLLRIYGRAIGLPVDFTVIDQADAADLMNLIRNELGLVGRERRFPKKQTLVSIYSRTVNAQANLRDVLEAYFPWCAPEAEGVAQIFERYTARKSATHVLDYDDLLLYWDALCASASAGPKVADRFEHILVDEYQDTNAVQAQVLRGMRARNHNIMAVGDDAQAIYSFRAATVRNMLDFQQHFSEARIVKLEQNYRSTSPILAASNAVMDSAQERYTKELWSERHSGQKPILASCLDETEQCEAVCRLVLEHREQGALLQQQAVLFRAGHHSGELEIELARRNIPFHKYGGLKFVEAAHVKDMLAFLRVFENPFDEISWFRVLQMLDGVGPRTARKLMDELGVLYQEEDTARPAGAGEGAEGLRGRGAQGAGREGAEESGRSEARGPLRRLIEDPPEAPAAAREAFAAFGALVKNCTEISTNGHTRSRGPAVADQIEHIRGFYETIAKQRFDNWTIRLRDIEQLERIAARYRSRARFIGDLTLDPPSATSDLAGAPYLDEDFLILSTIHSAKGLEWDTVHIIHAADGMIPSDMSLGDVDGLEEERRLFYVAMTRAKNWLYVHFPLRYYRRPSRSSDRHQYATLTRFIDDRVRGLFEERAEGAPPAASDDHDGANAAKDMRARLNQLWERS